MSYDITCTDKGFAVKNYDLNFFLQHHDVFLQALKWLVFSASSGPGHIPIALTLTSAAWHILPHCLVWFSASNYYWMCLASLCIKDAPLRIWLVLGRFLREDHATASELLWTLQLKRPRFVFYNPMYFATFLQCTVTENLNQVYNL